MNCVDGSAGGGLNFG